MQAVEDRQTFLFMEMTEAVTGITQTICIVVSSSLVEVADLEIVVVTFSIHQVVEVAQMGKIAGTVTTAEERKQEQV